MFVIFYFGEILQKQPQNKQTKKGGWRGGGGGKVKYEGLINAGLAVLPDTAELVSDLFLNPGFLNWVHLSFWHMYRASLCWWMKRLHQQTLTSARPATLHLGHTANTDISPTSHPSPWPHCKHWHQPDQPHFTLATLQTLTTPVQPSPWSHCKNQQHQSTLHLGHTANTDNTSPPFTLATLQTLTTPVHPSPWPHCKHWQHQSTLHLGHTANTDTSPTFTLATLQTLTTPVQPSPWPHHKHWQHQSNLHPGHTTNTDNTSPTFTLATPQTLTTPVQPSPWPHHKHWQHQSSLHPGHATNTDNTSPAFTLATPQTLTTPVQQVVNVTPHLGHTDGLLLHGLMDAGFVMLPDAAELIDAANASISQHQRPCLQLPLAWILQQRVKQSSTNDEEIKRNEVSKIKTTWNK